MSCCRRTIPFCRMLLTAAVLLTVVSDAAVWADNQTAASEASPVLAEFTNPGVYSHIANGLRYEWIPTEEVGFEIQPDGSVRMTAPETRPSTDGRNVCRRFVYDHLHKRLQPREEEALFRQGLRLPPGNYGFAILWVKADSYDMVFREPWNLTCNPEMYRSNSAGVDYTYLSIVPVDRRDAVQSRATHSQVATAELQELTVPVDVQRVSWLPHYQLLPHDLQLPANKGFGITRLLWDIPMEQVYRKVTHIQYAYSALDNVPDHRKWRNKQAYNHQGQIASVQWLIDDHSLDRNFITASEMDENFGNHGYADHADRAQQVFRGIYRRMQTEAGVTSPNETRLYDDYFSALEGYDNSISFLHQFNEPKLTEGLSSQSRARQRLFEDQWQDCHYFTKGAYDYRNWMQGGYLDSYATSPEGIRIYNQIYDYERKAMAAPDRRVIKFGWSNAEGVNSNMYRSGTTSRLRFEAGDIIRDDVVSWPFEMMLGEAFWALLLGDDYVLWHSNITLLQDPLTFRDSWCAGARETRWQPHGGSIIDYNPDQAGHPPRRHDPRGQFPNNPHVGESGAFAGAWLVGQITAVSDRTSAGLYYAPFRYSVAGGEAQPGYRDSEQPQPGQRGDARLSHGGVINEGQANIVASYAARKPICILGQGRDGGVVIYQNIHCGLTDENVVTVQTAAGERTFRTTGNRLHLFPVS